ncbi:hypothetical protein ACRE_000640 [Hapsidospora chrysogenum ATCC 11550]|uniref:Uncharacterized protein n=1 Tax=Hapsidospora chrysogenum (strain ATCC 11550 / CBS 779.69 / DSM 880 / IAM 14645 / JCM 23072 / IMI 49137) TaxID=857340 RepID=A0A086TI63_HAPC1|nr:hypothetical protein ACRE_000640 [Hapsidospora chrysogenum ATCC 11550]
MDFWTFGLLRPRGLIPTDVAELAARRALTSTEDGPSVERGGRDDVTPGQTPRRPGALTRRH